MYQDGVVSAYTEDDSNPENRTCATSETPETPRSNRPRQWKCEDEELLIQSVSTRAPLWDFRLPLKSRGRNTTKNLWEEIILEMNGKKIINIEIM